MEKIKIRDKKVLWIILLIIIVGSLIYGIDYFLNINKKIVDSVTYESREIVVEGQGVNIQYVQITSGVSKSIIDSINQQIKDNIFYCFDDPTASAVQDFSFWSHGSMGVDYNSDGILSLKISYENYCGGAHPNSGSFGLTFDLSNGKEITFQDLFTNYARDKNEIEKIIFTTSGQIPPPDPETNNCNYTKDWQDGLISADSIGYSVSSTGLRMLSFGYPSVSKVCEPVLQGDIILPLFLFKDYLKFDIRQILDIVETSKSKKYTDVKEVLLRDGWEVYVPADFVSANDKNFPEIGDCGIGYDAVCTVSFKKGETMRTYTVQIGGRSPDGPYQVWTVIDVNESIPEWVFNNQIATTTKYIIKSSPTAIVINDAKNASKIISVLSLSDIPPYDFGNNGQPSNSITDYYFDVNTVFDSLGENIFFSVNNHVTAGNANAERALFSYNINTKKLVLLKQEFSTSFDSLFPSADGRYLVYSEGSHGGMCNNVNGLGVHDLVNNKDLDIAGDLMPDNYNSVIEFDHWIDNSSFVYEQSYYTKAGNCANEFEPQSTKTIYYIK